MWGRLPSFLTRSYPPHTLIVTLGMALQVWSVAATVILQNVYLMEQCDVVMATVQ